MSNVLLSWGLPQPTTRQRPIDHVRIEARVSDGEPWTVIGEIAAPTAELLIENAAPGTWFYQGTVVDEAGRESKAVGVSIDVPFDEPSALTELTASLV